MSRASRARRRLDAELVRRELASGRDRARELIAAGRVLVAGAPADKAARLVSTGEPIVVTGLAERYVSRGGAKLEAALERFGLDVCGHSALDAGASTGGFTDCLLQRGATRVVALDVGRGQLHEKLRADERVVPVEGANVRHLRPDDHGGPFDITVADLSFISLGTVIGVLVDATRPDGELVTLVKPQFEAGRAVASRGKGVVRDPEVWAEVLARFDRQVRAAGAGVVGLMPSPITGARGNVEFLAHLRHNAFSGDQALQAEIGHNPIDETIAQVTREALGLAEGRGGGSSG